MIRRPRRTLSAVAGLALLLLAALSLSLLRREDTRGREDLQASTGLVAEVIDGDTFRLEGGERVRLLGIDAPEKDSPLHTAAREGLRGLLGGRRVQLTVMSPPFSPRGDASPATPRDVYGRTLALVHAGEVLVNEEMLARGLALVYLKQEGEVPPEVERRLVEAQRRAIAARRGLWGLRGAIEDRPGERLLATRHRFHRPSCPALKESGARGRPLSRAAALESGRSPCRTCNPRRRCRSLARARRRRTCGPGGGSAG